MNGTDIKTRLYVGGALAADQELQLSADHAHFLGNVLRLKPRNRIAVFNEVAGEWVGSLAALKKKNAVVSLERQSRPAQSEPGPWLAFAPLKKDRTHMIIEKATELGVERLFPVITQNTIGGRVNRQRMMAQAVEATEQSERLSVPCVEEPQTLEEFLQNWSSGRVLLAGDETGGGRPIADVISSNDKKSEDYGILVGPEGGFQKDERDLLKAADFCTLIDLGPRILRAETAAIASLACIQALT